MGKIWHGCNYRYLLFYFFTAEIFEENIFVWCNVKVMVNGQWIELSQFPTESDRWW